MEGGKTSQGGGKGGGGGGEEDEEPGLTLTACGDLLWISLKRSLGSLGAAAAAEPMAAAAPSKAVDLRPPPPPLPLMACLRRDWKSWMTSGARFTGPEGHPSSGSVEVSVAAFAPERLYLPFPAMPPE